MFQIINIDLNDIYTLCHVAYTCFYDKSFMRKVDEVGTELFVK
jgi:hypothetical protein